jgi:hypothetical protein
MEDPQRVWIESEDAHIVRILGSEPARRWTGGGDLPPLDDPEDDPAEDEEGPDDDDGQ